MGSRSRRTQSVRWARGRNDEYAWSESAGLAYSSCNSTLVGHLRGAVTQQCQDLDGGRGELGDEPVGEAGGHPARGRTGRVGFHSGGVGDGATGLLARSTSEPPQAANATIHTPTWSGVGGTVPAMQQTQAAPPATLDAVLERITYANQETGYTVARVATDRSGDLLTVVGALLGAQPGESLRLQGRWASHP